MKVWVMECGCYSDRYFAGVFVSAEIAMQQWDEDHNKDGRYHWRYEEHEGWKGEGLISKEWTNEGDWADAVSIIETEVIGSSTPSTSAAPGSDEVTG